jgi:nickel-dependent lactate racemase
MDVIVIRSVSFMCIELPFGKTKVNARLPHKWKTSQLTFPAEVTQERQTIEQAIAEPINTPRLEEIARNKKKAVVLVSDKTRLSPTAYVLPFILEKLHNAGLTKKAITVVVALGTHPPLNEGELRELVGKEIFQSYLCIQHSPEEADCINVGTSSMGTPIALFRPVVEADLRIATGNIEPHKLVGFSGGVKAVNPGCASRTTIYHNHKNSRTLFPSAGTVEHPIRHDLEEVQQFAPIDFLLNTIIHPDGTVLHAVAGDPILAHRQGCEWARPIFFQAVDKLYDIVIASCGGYPKDINLYQSVKTLQSAAKMCRDGGAIIWLAECNEGFANEEFRRWTEAVTDPKQTIERFYDAFSLGGHKTAYILEITQSKQVWMVTGMKDASLSKLGLHLASSVQEAIDQIEHQIATAASITLAIDTLSPNVLVAPYGGFIHPFFISP